MHTYRVYTRNGFVWIGATGYCDLHATDLQSAIRCIAHLFHVRRSALRGYQIG